jgi:2-hydroxychromene-2-carboxylate isomerase
VPAHPPIFYYDVNSPYAYLAAMRVRDVVPSAVWRPIAFGIVLQRLGRVPWSLDERRDDGMRDVEARAASRGLPPVAWPEGWPAGTWSFAPLRAAVHAEERGALVPFSLECFRLMFAEGRSTAELDNVLAAAEAAGLDRDETRAAIDDPAVKERLRQYTDEALARGLIGVPTTAVGHELFWGDDRLEDAAAALSAAA